MTSPWICVLCLYLIFPTQAVDFYRPAIVSVKSGERVTLNCKFLDKQKSKTLMVWYQQKVGELPQEVGKNSQTDTNLLKELNNSRFKVETTTTGLSLTILQARKNDEGLYFCGIHTWDKFEFSSGTFLAVQDNQEFKVSVFQNMLDLVPVGSSVNLQCSVFSESRTAELQVLWFRSAAPQPRPQIIYTHLNSSHQCKNSSSTYTCVYNFSKSILTLNDTGTYYCAVAMCGKIIFGNGTTVQVASLDPVVISLAVSLMVCVVVIIVQASFSCKRNLHKQVEGRPQQSYVLNQSPDALELNYAAVHLKRKAKRVREKGEQVTECVYSEVITSLND